MDKITIIKDAMNIFFFISVSTVTILSYLQAKKTIFSPIKAEVFKFQLEQFKEILAELQDKSEVDFCHQFDFDGLVYVNAIRMVNSYAKVFFDKKIFDEEKSEKLISGAIVSEKYIRKAGHLTGGKHEDNEAETFTLTPENWGENSSGFFHITKKYSENYQKIQTFIRSPLLPEKIKKELKIFDNIIHENLMILAKNFDLCSNEMPDKFNSVELLHHFSDAWISNRFNKSRIPFQAQAEAVLDAISNYLMVEEIIKR